MNIWGCRVNLIESAKARNPPRSCDLGGFAYRINRTEGTVQRLLDEPPLLSLPALLSLPPLRDEEPPLLEPPELEP